METIEEKIKKEILKNYKNLTAFCSEIGMPWTTLDSILKRGVAKASITNVLKITNGLGIDAESLLDNLIVPRAPIQEPLTFEDRKLIEDFHFLDEFGQTNVLSVIANEKNRCISQNREKEESIS